MPCVWLERVVEHARLDVLVEGHERGTGVLVLLDEAEVALDAVDEPHDGILAHGSALLQLGAGDLGHGRLLHVGQQLHAPLLQVVHDRHRAFVLVGHDTVDLRLEE